MISQSNWKTSICNGIAIFHGLFAPGKNIRARFTLEIYYLAAEQ